MLLGPPVVSLSEAILFHLAKRVRIIRYRTLAAFCGLLNLIPAPPGLLQIVSSSLQKIKTQRSTQGLSQTLSVTYTSFHDNRKKVVPRNFKASGFRLMTFVNKLLLTAGEFLASRSVLTHLFLACFYNLRLRQITAIFHNSLPASMHLQQLILNW